MSYVNTDGAKVAHLTKDCSDGPAKLLDGYPNIVKDGVDIGVSTRLADLIAHEHLHQFYTTGHVCNTILQDGSPYFGADYNNNMIKILQKNFNP